MAQRCELCTYWRRDATLAQKCSRAKCGGVSVRQVIIQPCTQHRYATAQKSLAAYLRQATTFYFEGMTIAKKYSKGKSGSVFVRQIIIEHLMAQRCSYWLILAQRCDPSAEMQQSNVRRRFCAANYNTTMHIAQIRSHTKNLTAYLTKPTTFNLKRMYKRIPIIKKFQKKNKTKFYAPKTFL